MNESPRFDYVLVGGGLANGLIALELLRCRPEATVALVERDATLGGNHTWSFHEHDVPASLLPTVESLAAHRWPAYEVLFPRRRRRLALGYGSLSNADLERELRRAFAERPDCRLFTSCAARSVEARRVTLAGGAVVEGKVVLDGRGPPVSPTLSGGGYQKFLGLELRLATPSPRLVPLLMDVLVPQADGLRFVYVLPFEAERVLIEDTYYSISPRLDRALLRENVLRYAKDNGYVVDRVVREEAGSLPIPVRPVELPRHQGPIRVGWGGGWFHPTTGYSLPVAARVARFVAEHEPEALGGPAFEGLRRDHLRQARFARGLNRLLFGAFPPQERFRVLERFYGLPPATIARFFALQTTAADRLRILCGAPPRGFSVTRLLTGGAPA